MNMRGRLPHMDRIRETVMQHTNDPDGFTTGDLVSSEANSNQIGSVIREFLDKKILFGVKIKGLARTRYFGSSSAASDFREKNSVLVAELRKARMKELRARESLRLKQQRSTMTKTRVITNNFLFGGGISPKAAEQIVNGSEGSHEDYKSVLAKANDLIKQSKKKETYGRAKTNGEISSRAALKTLPKNAKIVFPPGLKIQVYSTQSGELQLTQLRDVTEDDRQRAQEDLMRTHPEYGLKEVHFIQGENDEEDQEKFRRRERDLDEEG